MVNFESCHTCTKKDCCANYDQMKKESEVKFGDSTTVAGKLALNLRAMWLRSNCDDYDDSDDLPKKPNAVNTDFVSTPEENQE